MKMSEKTWADLTDDCRAIRLDQVARLNGREDWNDAQQNCPIKALIAMEKHAQSLYELGWQPPEHHGLAVLGQAIDSYETFRGVPSRDSDGLIDRDLAIERLHSDLLANGFVWEGK